MVKQVTKIVFVAESDNTEFTTHHEAGIHEDVVILRDFLTVTFPDMGAPKIKAIATTIAERYGVTERVIDALAVGKP